MSLGSADDQRSAVEADRTLAALVIDECRKYGLEEMCGGEPVRLFPVLMQHVYANRDLTNEMNEHSIEQLLALISRLAPEMPINQDEQGGCVWCAGTPPGQAYGYAGSNPVDHMPDCVWVEAQKVLGNRELRRQGRRHRSRSASGRSAAAE